MEKNRRRLSSSSSLCLQSLFLVASSACPFSPLSFSHPHFHSLSPPINLMHFPLLSLTCSPHSIPIYIAYHLLLTFQFSPITTHYCSVLIFVLYSLIIFEMAVSGFEGFEKRLELHFSGDDPVVGMGLRNLDFELLEQVLHAVQCTVVSAVGNHYFDAYVLSESSLFVYPTKIIIKTCGTTQLLKSIPPLLHHGRHLGLAMCGCRYTRGSFIFPKAQPYPHTSFRDEVIYLEQSLPSALCYRKASVMPSKMSSHSWHVFSASDEPHMVLQHMPDVLYTLEVCMTDLDRVLARKFFLRPGGGKAGDVAGKEMTELTGISDINPGALICDFAFDPCGYSMNGIDGDRYSTIHVTPEDGYSYASFECVGSIYDDQNDVVQVLKKVVQVFRPATMSVSTTCSSHEVWTRVATALEPMGLKCRSCAVDEFPASGTVVFQTFTTRRKEKRLVEVDM